MKNFQTLAFILLLSAFVVTFAQAESDAVYTPERYRAKFEQEYSKLKEIKREYEEKYKEARDYNAKLKERARAIEEQLKRERVEPKQIKTVPNERVIEKIRQKEEELKDNLRSADARRAQLKERYEKRKKELEKIKNNPEFKKEFEEFRKKWDAKMAGYKSRFQNAKTDEERRAIMKEVAELRKEFIKEQNDLRRKYGLPAILPPSNTKNTSSVKKITDVRRYKEGFAKKILSEKVKPVLKRIAVYQAKMTLIVSIIENKIERAKRQDLNIYKAERYIRVAKNELDMVKTKLYEIKSIKVNTTNDKELIEVIRKIKLEIKDMIKYLKQARENIKMSIYELKKAYESK